MKMKASEKNPKENLLGKQITRGYNIIADKWAGAYIPPFPTHTHNSRKSIKWSAVPVPCLCRLWLKLRGEQGSGPEGVDDLCFHTYGEFSPSPPSIRQSVRPPFPQPPGPYLSLYAYIPASRPIPQPPGPNLILEAQIP